MFTGIVEEIGRVRDVRAHDGMVRLTVDSARVRPRLAKGGSVAVDGCCQTVTALDDQGFTVALIPTTLAETVAGSYAPGRRVNVEVDLVARYLERLTGPARSE